MKYIIENNKSNYKDEVDRIITDRQDEIFSFFNSPKVYLNCSVYIYDSIESLVIGLRERGFYKDPDYVCACFKDKDNSINFFEPKDNPSDDEWSKEEYENVIFHELIHAIQFSLFGTTKEWLNEGIAKYLDGTYSKGIKWLLENYINKNSIPKQSEIENEFGFHNYDSYCYAFIMVSFLIEVLGKDNFIELIKDSNKLNSVKDGLLIKAINYYNRKYNIDTISKYLNQDINNPKYLFHGSPKLLESIKPHKSHDSNNNLDNISNAVFLFPSFLKATPYAFKDTIKKMSDGLDWNFEITNNDDYPLMKMENVNVSDDITGYIYVFLNNEDMIKDSNDYQYKCFKEITPIDIIEVRFDDYKQYYSVNDDVIIKDIKL